MRFTVNRICKYACLFVVATFAILMLCFPTLRACKEASLYLYPDADSGFVWLTFESNISYGSDWDAYKGMLGLISILQLMIGISAIALSIVFFFVAPSKEDRALYPILFVSLGSMFLYMLEGIIYKNIYCEIMGYKESYFTTDTYIPFIIGALATVGFFVVSKVVRSKKAEEAPKKEQQAYTANSQNFVSEERGVDLIKKYKELLDAGVITQEEFDAKKKEILHL